MRCERFAHARTTWRTSSFVTTRSHHRELGGDADHAPPTTREHRLDGARADCGDARRRGAVPAAGHTIGKLDVPASVANLLGGADYGTITGWFRSEIASIYGPLVIGALAITGATAATAGEEEDRILALVVAHPIGRSRLLAAKAVAIAAVVVLVALATWVGMVVGVALGGGGISLGNISAFAVQLAFFGFATEGLAIALGAGTGRRTLAAGVAAA